MNFSGKTILILSSEDWGEMLLSKHHYAIDLAKIAKTVYFLNTPGEKYGLKSRFIEKSISHTPGIKIIHQELFFPNKLKFHAFKLYQKLMKWHLRQLLKFIGTEIDVVWSFDLQGKYPLRFFPESAFKIYFPTDEPIIPNSFEAAKDSDLIISITREILEKFYHNKARKLLLSHGLADEFIKGNQEVNHDGNSLQVGLSGNFLRADIDRPILLKIISENPNVFFKFWGSFEPRGSNIGGSTAQETIDFIKKLMSYSNVEMFGIVSKLVLAKGFSQVDAFLICYDIKKDHSKGTNYHKIMEYLSSGKAIISNNVSAYVNSENLIYMVNERTNNQRLPELFQAIIKDISRFNSQELIDMRIKFARSNSYTNQVKKIESFLSDVE